MATKKGRKKKRSKFLTVVIAICGTHGSGKTILMTSLAQILRKAGFNVSTIGELATDAPAYGFPINQKTTPQAQMWILDKLFETMGHLINSGIYHAIITDRWVDNAAYAKLRFGKRGDSHVMVALAHLDVIPCDRVFVTRGRTDFLVSNGTRAVDPKMMAASIKFQRDAERAILGLFKYLAQKTGFRYEILPETDNVEERERLQLEYILRRLSPLLRSRFPNMPLPHPNGK